jgi:hypothetical protein
MAKEGASERQSLKVRSTNKPEGGVSSLVMEP